MNIKEYISESNAIEDIWGEEEVKQSLIAWKYLNKLQKISHYDICRVQKIITLHQTDLLPNQRGYYRSFSKTNVKIGWYYAPKYQEVDDLMDKWLKDLPKMPPLIAHLRFETIHPFVDGNGRVGRMLYWWLCMIGEKKPNLYTAKKKDKYYMLFQRKKIKSLEESNWGIDFQNKYKYEVTVKTDKGLKRCGFFRKPTDEEIKSSIPKGELLMQIISVKEL